VRSVLAGEVDGAATFDLHNGTITELHRADDAGVEVREGLLDADHVVGGLVSKIHRLGSPSAPSPSTVYSSFYTNLTRCLGTDEVMSGRRCAAETGFIASTSVRTRFGVGRVSEPITSVWASRRVPSYSLTQWPTLPHFRHLSLPRLGGPVCSPFESEPEPVFFPPLFLPRLSEPPPPELLLRHPPSDSFYL
jgi:hypothetical protein